jgi:hypothetical protein
LVMAFGLTETVASVVLLAAPPLAGVLFEIHSTLPYAVSLALILVSATATTVYVRRAHPPSVPIEPAHVERIPVGE